MFDYLKAVGLPGGPLAEPFTVYRAGPRGKLHFDGSHAGAYEPVDVSVWDRGASAFCSHCLERKFRRVLKNHEDLLDDLRLHLRVVREVVDMSQPLTCG